MWILNFDVQFTKCDLMVADVKKDVGHSQLHSWVDNIKLKSSQHRTMTGVAYERIENHLLKTMHCC